MSAFGRDVCGRFAFFAPPEVIAEQFGVEVPVAVEPRYNICPTQYVAAIRSLSEGDRSLGMLRWGLIPRWAKDPSIGQRMINARAETVDQKPAFRDAFARRRCLVLASGFYEWGQTPSGKWPFFITLKNAELMAFAGLWERWRSPTDEAIESCVIVTTSASPQIAAVHERMPVILPPDAQTAWLAPDTAPDERLALLGAAEQELKLERVERTVNSPSNEGPELIRPAAAESS